MPMGFGLWKIEHPGHASAVFAMRNPGVQLRNYQDPHDTAPASQTSISHLQLAEAESAPAEMVLVQLGSPAGSPHPGE